MQTHDISYFEEVIGSLDQTKIQAIYQTGSGDFSILSPSLSSTNVLGPSPNTLQSSILPNANPQKYIPVHTHLELQTQ